MTEIVSVRAAADYLAVDRSTIYRMLGDGRLTGYRLAGVERLGVDLAEVDAKIRPTKLRGRGWRLGTTTPPAAIFVALCALAAPERCVRIFTRDAH